MGTKKGLNRFDQKTGKFSNCLNENASSIFFIFEDRQNRIWVGTYRSGLYTYNNQSGNFSLFNDSTGLLKNNILVRGITEDRAHLLWLNTDIGFIKLNPETKNAVLFGKSWDIDPKITIHGEFTSLDGEIFIADTAGYYHFQPQLFEKEMGSGPQPYISKFYINNTELLPGNDKILPQFFSETGKITLNHDQNNFAIEFNNIDFITLEAEKNILF